MHLGLVQARPACCGQPCARRRGSLRRACSARFHIRAGGEEGRWAPGAASRWWLHGSLLELDEQLAALGSRLILRRSADTLGEQQAVAAAVIDWAAGMRAAWNPGSTAAIKSFEHFLHRAFDDYPGARDRPDRSGTSRLSPHLHFGEIGPRQIWHGMRRFAQSRGRHSTWRQSQFLTEVGWREFAHHLLYHFPQTPEHPLRTDFARFPWKSDRVVLGHVGGCRSRQQYPGVAMGVRMRGRRSALLSDIQSPHPGNQIRSPRYLCTTVGA